jgi:glycosyltransferase involved in cell wall biosynthesis
MLRFFCAFTWLVIRERPDVVHLHSTFAGILGRFSLLFLRGLIRPRIVYCPHAFAFLMQTSSVTRSAYAFIERALALWTDRIICVSEHEMRHAVESGLPHDRLVLIHNGVSERMPKSGVVGDASDVQLLFVGRLDHQKGFDVLLDAMEKLEHEAFHLTVVGGSVLGRTQPPARPNITYAGWLDAGGAERAFRAADVLIVPSRWEGFAMVPLEAMSHGLPVIASDCSSFPEMITHGVNGLLFPVEDGAMLVECIRSRSIGEWAAMGRNGYLTHRERFTSSRMLRETAHVYFDVTRTPSDAAAARPRYSMENRNAIEAMSAFVTDKDEMQKQDTTYTSPDSPPLVSVYIPTKNRLLLLQRAVQSVLNQTYPNIELVVADDGSTDGSREYLSTLAEAGTIKLVLMPSSMGACVARNFAITATTGEFVTGLDDDDYFLPHRIGDFVDRWRRVDSSYGAVAGLYQATRLLLVSGEERVFTKMQTSSEELRSRNYVGTQVFAPKAHFIGAGLFDPAMPCWQDWDLWTRMAARFGTFIGGGNASYVWDMSTVGSHTSNKPEFQIRHGFQLFAHKLKLRSSRDRAGPLGTLSLYPQVRLAPAEIVTLALSPHWRDAVKYVARKVLSESYSQRLRMYFKQKITQRI